jgi:hypothetical protein
MRRNNKRQDETRTHGSSLLFSILICCALMFCSVLFCSVLFCSVLFCSVLFCSVLFCSVLFCSVLFCSTLFYSILFSVLYLFLLSPIHYLLFCRVLSCSANHSTSSSHRNIGDEAGQYSAAHSERQQLQRQETGARGNRI